MKAVFDIDGTVSDNRHRLHLIRGKNKEWRKYLGKAGEDPVVEEGVELFRKLSEDHDIVFMTMRSEEIRGITEDWLERKGLEYEKLIMLDRDSWKVPDQEYKRRKLDELENVHIAVDDKERICQMYREEGLNVYKVDWCSEPEIKKYGR